MGLNNGSSPNNLAFNDSISSSLLLSSPCIPGDAMLWKKVLTIVSGAEETGTEYLPLLWVAVWAAAACAAFLLAASEISTNIANSGIKHMSTTLLTEDLNMASKTFLYALLNKDTPIQSMLAHSSITSVSHSSYPSPKTSCGIS